MSLHHDRKNQLIHDALESGAYKQALQLCNKRTKKGEKNDYLLVTPPLSPSRIDLRPSTWLTQLTQFANPRSRLGPESARTRAHQHTCDH